MGIFFLVLLRRVEMILVALVRRQIAHRKNSCRFPASIGVVTTLGQLQQKEKKNLTMEKRLTFENKRTICVCVSHR
jgi:hypothetical protein